MSANACIRHGQEVSAQNIGTARRLFVFAMSALAAGALCMNISAPWGADFNGVAEEMVGNLASSFHGSAFMSTLLTLGLYTLSRRVTGFRLKGNWAALLLAALTALVWLAGACFLSGGDISILCSSPGQSLKAVIYS